MIIVKAPKKGPQEMCINPDCPSKEQETNGQPLEEEGMVCPTCQQGKMVLRKSFYGQFLGCDNYPRCKTMMKIVDGKVDTSPIVKTGKPKKSATKKNMTKKAAKKKKTVKKSPNPKLIANDDHG